MHLLLDQLFPHLKMGLVELQMSLMTNLLSGNF